MLQQVNQKFIKREIKNKNGALSNAAASDLTSRLLIVDSLATICWWIWWRVALFGPKNFSVLCFRRTNIRNRYFEQLQPMRSGDLWPELVFGYGELIFKSKTNEEQSNITIIIVVVFFLHVCLSNYVICTWLVRMAALIFKPLDGTWTGTSAPSAHSPTIIIVTTITVTSRRTLNNIFSLVQVFEIVRSKRSNFDRSLQFAFTVWNGRCNHHPFSFFGFSCQSIMHEQRVSTFALSNEFQFFYCLLIVISYIVVFWLCAIFLKFICF